MVSVVTVPDKQQGRGRREQPSAVKVTAIELDLPVIQPESLNSEDFINTLESLSPDLIVVVAFRILPESVFTLPRLGSFNLHASLLPKYRGAAPIHWALLNGETETGVTTFFLKRSVDTGGIIKQSKVSIVPEDNLYSLYDKLCLTGADLVLETVNMIANGNAEAKDQNNDLATPAPKVTSETRELDFNESAEQCHNRIRAFAPKPGAYTTRDGKMLKVLLSRIVEGEGEPGRIIRLSKTSFAVACRDKALEICSLQPESKKAMDAESYLRGYPIQQGEIFG